MHTIVTDKKINGLLAKMYVVAIMKVMGVDLPCRVKLNSHAAERTYTITGYCVGDVKIEKPGG